jgi:hypothetical protein
MIGTLRQLLILGGSVLAASMLAWVVFRIAGWRDRATQRLCGRCRHSAEGLTHPQCPECGADLTKLGVIAPGTRLWRRVPLPIALIALAAGLGIIAYVLGTLLGRTPIAGERQAYISAVAHHAAGELPDAKLEHTSTLAWWSVPRVRSTLATQAAVGSPSFVEYSNRSFKAHRWSQPAVGGPPVNTIESAPPNDPKVDEWLAECVVGCESPSSVVARLGPQLTELRALLASPDPKQLSLRHWSLHAKSSTSYHTTPVAWLAWIALAALAWLVGAVRVVIGARSAYPPRVRTVAWTSSLAQAPWTHAQQPPPMAIPTSGGAASTR